VYGSISRKQRYLGSASVGRIQEVSIVKAMVIRDFGGPEVFEEREMPRPEPRPTEVLVKVYATSVNPVDISIRKAGSRADIKPPAIIGYDVSGTGEAVGSEAENLEAGGIKGKIVQTVREE